MYSMTSSSAFNIGQAMFAYLNACLWRADDLLAADADDYAECKACVVP